jgi:hypothetical protein
MHLRRCRSRDVLDRVARGYHDFTSSPGDMSYTSAVTRGLWMAVLVCTAGCSQRSAPGGDHDGTNAASPDLGSKERDVADPRPAPPAPPTRDEVIAAVSRTGDRELVDLVAGQFGVRPTDLPGVEHHRIYRVVLADTDHPMSFWLATDASGASPRVLSQRLEAVVELLRAEPALLGAADLPVRFHELYRDQGAQAQVLDDPPPAVERAADGLRLTLAVRTGGVDQRWDVLIPEAGEPSMTVSKLP